MEFFSCPEAARFWDESQNDSCKTLQSDAAAASNRGHWEARMATRRFQGMTDGFKLRRGTIDAGVSLITDIKTAIFTSAAMHKKWVRESKGKSFWDVSSWQEYVEIVERLS